MAVSSFIQFNRNDTKQILIDIFAIRGVLGGLSVDTTEIHFGGADSVTVMGKAQDVAKRIDDAREDFRMQRRTMQELKERVIRMYKGSPEYRQVLVDEYNRGFAAGQTQTTQI